MDIKLRVQSKTRTFQMSFEFSGRVPSPNGRCGRYAIRKPSCAFKKLKKIMVSTSILRRLERSLIILIRRQKGHAQFQFYPFRDTARVLS